MNETEGDRNKQLKLTSRSKVYNMHSTVNQHFSVSISKISKHYNCHYLTVLYQTNKGMMNIISRPLVHSLGEHLRSRNAQSAERLRTDGEGWVPGWGINSTLELA
jgi:hypothetical protein